MVKDQRVRADNAKSTVVEKLEYDKGYSNRLNTTKNCSHVGWKSFLRRIVPMIVTSSVSEPNSRRSKGIAATRSIINQPLKSKN